MRGKRATKRPTKQDEIYGSIVITKLINKVMYDGKKSVAQKAVYEALEELSQATKESPLKSLEKAFGNVRPRVEIRSKRVGGANYQVPTPVREERQFALAMKWVIEAARSSRGSLGFSRALAREMLAAYKNEGSAVRKKEEVQRMAEANQAFAQYA